MINNLHKDNIIDDLRSDDPLKQTEAAYLLSNQTFNHESLVNFLTSDNENLKCFALLKLNEIRNEYEAQALLSCLKSKDSRLREISSDLVRCFVKNPEYSQLFNNNEAMDAITDSIKDKNPRVCRNITNTLQYINNRLKILEKLIKIIKDNEDILINYWILFAIESLITNNISENILINDIITLVDRTSKHKEYQIREKSAFIVKILINLNSVKLVDTTHKNLNILTRQLINDKNFYVRNAILCE